MNQKVFLKKGKAESEKHFALKKWVVENLDVFGSDLTLFAIEKGTPGLRHPETGRPHGYGIVDVWAKDSAGRDVLFDVKGSNKCSQYWTGVPLIKKHIEHLLNNPRYVIVAEQISKSLAEYAIAWESETELWEVKDGVARKVPYAFHGFDKYQIEFDGKLVRPGTGFFHAWFLKASGILGETKK